MRTRHDALRSMLLNRNWKGERNWWLDHYYQWSPGQRRSSKAAFMTTSDYVAIPLPTNVPTPLAGPCLIWRWALEGNGYGNLNGKGTHVVAYEQSREVAVNAGSSILHLCHRPFCVQPAHLYEGTALENTEDRRALNSEMRTYTTWGMIRDRHQKAFTEYRWPTPPLEGLIPHLDPDEALECPHAFTRTAGTASQCANCGQSSSESLFDGHRIACHMPGSGPDHRPCRCLSDPCSCRACLTFLLGPAQRAHESARGPIDGPLYNFIPTLLHSGQGPIPRKEARAIRIYLETIAQVRFPILYAA